MKVMTAVPKKNHRDMGCVFTNNYSISKTWPTIKNETFCFVKTECMSPFPSLSRFSSTPWLKYILLYQNRTQKSIQLENKGEQLRNMKNNKGF